MPLRSMLPQHILDKPLRRTPSCTSQYLSCTKCSYEGLNRTWKKQGLLKRGPQECLDHEFRALGVVIADCEHVQSAGCECLPWARVDTCTLKNAQDVAWSSDDKGQCASMCLCKGFNLLFVTSKGFQRQAFQVLVEWQSISQRQHLIGRKAFQLQVLTHRHLFEEDLFLQTDDAFRIGSVSKDRLFHFGSKLCRGHRDPAMQVTAITGVVIDSIDSLVLEIHRPQ